MFVFVLGVVVDFLAIEGPAVSIDHLALGGEGSVQLELTIHQSDLFISIGTQEYLYPCAVSLEILHFLQAPAIDELVLDEEKGILYRIDVA